MQNKLIAPVLSWLMHSPQLQKISQQRYFNAARLQHLTYKTGVFNSGVIRSRGRSDYNGRKKKDKQ
jgi:hypothetical protein